ncbi:kinase domain protein [Dictyocaulus viviparus]|uniref:non-specific serine/threonine protein kinase n=1 Tax=Dictyocaulus viviparus TaxID=29172 RepID=A0A0D8Y017_DICVI|nr:kinase domain protein [Dictyocaulus viviparus]
MVMGTEHEAVSIQLRFFGEWVIVKKLDEGGFGHVYKVESNTRKGQVAALKAEPNDVEGGSAIKLEIAILRAMNEDGEKPHIPNVFHAAKHKKYCYMVMTLLGENLKSLKINCPKELMSPNTWSRIAVQCLYSVKLVHDYGYVHRDIKPNNFVMGYRHDLERARIVHILDFGLARSYAAFKNGKWVARRARGSAEFRGTLRYCSPNVHEKKEQGRRDDLWSLFYVLIELHCGLPWQTVRDKSKVETMKMNMSDKHLVQNFPPELRDVIPYLRTLDCYQRPNYSMFYDGLVALMKRLGTKPSDPYDWETKEQVELVASDLKNTKPAAWEDAEQFFKSDPININAPPLPNPNVSKTFIQSIKLYEATLICFP